MNDAERVSQDPTFRLIGSEKIWERGAALTSRLQSFETELLTQDENLAGLATINRELIAHDRPVPEWRNWPDAGNLISLSRPIFPKQRSTSGARDLYQTWTAGHHNPARSSTYRLCGNIQVIENKQRQVSG
jgi:hypothetical protein